MAFTHTFQWSLSTGSGSSLNGSFTDVYGSEQPNLDEVVAPSTTALNLDWTASTTRLKEIVMLFTADTAGGDITIETNATATLSGTPQETIVLSDGVPLIWFDNGVVGSAAAPFLGDVTTIYVTTTTGGDLRIRGLEDPTI
jgi:hypothetical protein